MGNPVYKIHPAIGIARLGDHSSFFIGPETPGLRPTGEKPGGVVPPYKQGGLIKAQGARFRIFEYTEVGGVLKANREINMQTKGVLGLTWNVHLANKKASFFVFDGLAGNDRRNTLGRRNAAVVDRKKLEIDPRLRSISGRNAKPVPISKGTSKNSAQESWPDPKPVPEITVLGKLLTDDAGRLIVLGGLGISSSTPAARPISNYANNDGWYDDVSDGPVTATLNVNGKIVPVEPAWVLCCPPDFAPHLNNVVSLYDTLFDIAAREGGKPGQLQIPANEHLYSSGALAKLTKISADFKAAGKPVLSSYKPVFSEDIFPILFNAAASMFLISDAVGHHGGVVSWATLGSNDPANLAARQSVLAFIRPPDAAPSSNLRMPKLLGDEPYPLAAGVIHQRVLATVTPTQFAMLQQWAKGQFVETPPYPPTRPSSMNISPEGLDRAALENCVGAAMYPGIEVSWQIRDPKLFKEPFRIKAGSTSSYLGEAGVVVGPGHFSRQMALPWQADFLMCKKESFRPSHPFSGLGQFGWWPGQRPDSVFASDADFSSSPKKTELWHRSTKGGKSVNWPSGGTQPLWPEMLANWTGFGFVVEIDPVKLPNHYIETDRKPEIP